ncbi:MAG: MFS transporter [Pseudomonadota bacterium]
MSALFFASLGHALMHMLTAMFFVVVLALESAWTLPYAQLLPLWTAGALAVGVCALPAGWLADRWSAPGMLVVMFFGMGAACLLCASAADGRVMGVGLTLLGAFAAIYHPVGIPWLVRAARSERRGLILGANGVFGALGVAASGGVVAVLVERWGWQAAFIVPGAISLAAGIAMGAMLLGGKLPEQTAQRQASPADRSSTDEGTSWLPLAALLIAMFALGFIYQASQAVFPKVFAERVTGPNASATAAGWWITVVYGVAGIMQLAGGWLADRVPLRPLYASAALLQLPLLLLLASLMGMPLVVAATAAVVVSAGAMPAENMLLARHAPPARHGLFFGLKFVLAFGSAPLAVAVAAAVVRWQGSPAPLFFGLALLALLATLAAFTLPAARTPRAAPTPAPAA